jgi:phage terminase large subunit-like protein
VLARNENQTKWQSAVLVVPRKNGKSTLVAALALYHLLLGEGAPEILLAAASDKQAGRIFESVTSCIRMNPELAKQVHLREYVGEISRIDAPGKILRMASDPANLHGYNPSLVICDELAQWTKPSHRKAWVALTTGGGSRDLKQVITITTAGAAEERMDGTLGGLLDKNETEGKLEREDALTISRNEVAQTIIFNYSAPTKDPHDIPNMKLANPANWITEEFLQRQASNPELKSAEVLQYHGCVWSVGSKAWLPEGAWRMCEAERAIPDGASIMLGFDGSYNQDSTGLVACTMEEVPHVFVLGVWERPGGSREWIVPRDEVSLAVKRAFERYRVVEMLCDPSGWHREVEDWGQAYGSPPVISYPTNQRKMMSENCSRLYTAIMTKQVTHDGNPRLAAHMANAITKETPDGAYITKESRSSRRKIDLAVAAVIAFGRASMLQSGAWAAAW